MADDLRPTEVVAAFMEKYQWDITIGEDEDVGTVVILEVKVDRWIFDGPVA